MVEKNQRCGIVKKFLP